MSLSLIDFLLAINLIFHIVLELECLLSHYCLSHFQSLLHFILVRNLEVFPLLFYCFFKLRRYNILMHSKNCGVYSYLYVRDVMRDLVIKQKQYNHRSRDAL